MQLANPLIIPSPPGPSQPFAPDYFQTVISLCEVIRQLYTKLGTLLGPGATTPNLSDIRSAARSPGSVSGTGTGTGNSSPRAATFGLNKARTVSGMSGQMGSAGTSLHGGGPSLGGRVGWATGTGEQVMKMDLKLKVSPPPPRFPSARTRTRRADRDRHIENPQHVCERDGIHRAESGGRGTRLALARRVAPVVRDRIEFRRRVDI